MSERNGAREQSKQCGASKQVSSASEFLAILDHSEREKKQEWDQEMSLDSSENRKERNW